jgi:hypothetical protein
MHRAKSSNTAQCVTPNAMCTGAPVVPLVHDVDELHHRSNARVEAHLFGLCADLLDGGMQQPQLILAGRLVTHLKMTQELTAKSYSESRV